MYQNTSYEKKIYGIRGTETLNTDLIFDDNKELLLPILVVTMVLWICF